MKRIALALFILAVLLYTNAASGEAAAAIVIEQSTGIALYRLNETARLPMASTTKVMTALLAIERGALDAPVVAGENAFGVPGTSIYLEKGEVLTLEHMLYGLMLASGNDAAVAVAEHIGGSVEGFCALMNARAAELGCPDTHFVTPHGLPAGNHYTSAADLARIARQAMTEPAFRRIVSTQRATIPWVSRGYDRVLTNKNRLLSAYPGALGVKTGYTRAAGRCLVFAAERDGMTLLGVVLNCPDWFDHAQALLDNAFARYEMSRAFAAGDIVARLPVTGGVEEWAEVTVSRDVAAPVARGALPDVILSLPQALTAGFEKGDAVGRVTLALDGEALIELPLIALEGVPRATFRTALGDGLRRWLLLDGR